MCGILSAHHLSFLCMFSCLFSKVIATTGDAPGIVYADIDLEEVEVILDLRDWIANHPSPVVSPSVCASHHTWHPVSLSYFFFQNVTDSIPVSRQKRRDIYELHEVKKANSSPDPNTKS